MVTFKSGCRPSIRLAWVKNCIRFPKGTHRLLTPLGSFSNKPETRFPPVPCEDFLKGDWVAGRSPFQVCWDFRRSVPLAPETYSHSGVPSGRCSDFHHHTHNNRTPLPGSHSCLPRSRPAHLQFQLLAPQLPSTRCTGSYTKRKQMHPSKVLRKDSG